MKKWYALAWVIFSPVTWIYATNASVSTQTDTIATMTPAELSQLSQARVNGETNRIQPQLASKQQKLTYYQQLNQAYCGLLNQITSTCNASSYIGLDYGLANLNCSTDTNTSEGPVTPKIQVIMTNTGGNSFYLQANTDYQTGIITNPIQDVVFSPIDGQITEPPRFFNLTSLSLITVDPTRNNKNIKGKRPLNMGLVIKVNGTPLLSSCTLLAAADSSDYFTYQVSPDLIPKLKFQTGCYITSDELSNIQKTLPPQ